MRKLLLLLIALLTGVSGAWADALQVSTTENANAEYQYIMYCRGEKSYFLGNTTNATQSELASGRFAFFADASGDYTNGYYIYSVFEGKWVTYESAASYSNGKNMIILSSEKPSVPWHIAADNTDSKYYDIRPFKTDKTAADNSWNWNGGPSYNTNTNNTMGFYGYTDSNSGWGILLAGGSGSPSVADRKVVALYNVPSDNNEYPLLDDVKVPSTTGGTPQYFVLRCSGFDTYGEATYQIQKAEGDSKYLTYQGFNTAGESFMFLNTSSSYYSNYTYSTSNNTAAASVPYYNLFRKVGGTSPYEAWVFKCDGQSGNRFTQAYSSLTTPLDTKGNWNARWSVKVLSGYEAWGVVITGASAGKVTFTGSSSSIYTGATTTQSNDGIFVFSSDFTPTVGNFTASTVDGYCTDPVITVDATAKLIMVAYTSYTTEVNMLNNTPALVGYPSSTARATLQAAIDAFNASSKTLSDYSTLSTACSTFQNTNDIAVPEVGKIYTIQSYVSSSSTTAYLENVNGTFTISTTASETALQNLWIVRESGEYIVFQSASDFTKYLTYTSTGIAETGSTWDLSESRRKGSQWPYISLWNGNMAGTNDGRYLGCDGSSKMGKFGGSSYWGQNKGQYSGWSTDFKFVESDEYRLVTYNLKWNGDIIATQERLEEIGASSVSPWDAPAYCSFSYNVATISASTYTVDVTLNWTGPFDISSNYASAVWYYMKSNNTWVYYDSEDESKLPVVSTVEEARDKGDAALWAFIGNPNSGVQVINKAKGSGYYINVDSPVKMISSGYTITQIEDGAENGFSLSNTGYCFASNSSALVLQKAEYANRFLIVRSYYCQKALDDLADYASDNAVGQYFGVRQESIDLIQGVFEGMPNMTSVQYSTYSVPTGVSAYLNIKYPTTGYYRIKNNSTGNYLAYGTPTTSGGEARPVGLIATSNSTDAPSVIQLTGSKGTYKFSTQGLNIQGQTEANKAFPGTDATGVDFVFNISNPGIVSITNSASAVDANYDGSLHEATVDWGVHGVVNWKASYANSKWEIEDASSITIDLQTAGAASYATLYVDFPVAVQATDDNTAIYILTKDGDDYQIEKVSSVPAKTGIIVRNIAKASSVTLDIPASPGSDQGELTGTLLGTTAENYSYVFGYSAGEGIGFYPKSSGSSISANKAYLKTDEALVRGFSLNFEDDETGVEMMRNGENEKMKNDVFDLSGRRVATPSKGLYIVNGRKMVVK